MAGPFFLNVRAQSSGTAGTGAFTPGSVVAGGAAWSTVPAGWIGLVRYEDGSTSELRYGYWNGTTITRPANGLVWSSTGSGLNLTSAATAALIADGTEVQPHLGGVGYSLMVPLPGAATINFLGAVNTNLGTASLEVIAATNFLTEQPRLKWTSATTANAAAGVHMGTSPRCVYSTTAGRGGGEFTCRFGASQLPTGPRLWCGFQKAINSSVNEPSSYFDLALFAKDSGDTNIQLMTNDASGAATKIDTGIAWAANGWYEASIWFDPGGGRIYALLIRLDTGDIFYTTTTTDLPTNGSLLIPVCYGSLSATTGTALVLHVGNMMTRAGGG